MSDYGDVSNGDKSESEQVEPTYRSRIDEGGGDGERSVGHTLEIAEEWPLIVGAADVEDGTAEFESQEKHEKNCEDHAGQSGSGNSRMWDNKSKEKKNNALESKSNVKRKVKVDLMIEERRAMS